MKRLIVCLKVGLIIVFAFLCCEIALRVTGFPTRYIDSFEQQWANSGLLETDQRLGYRNKTTDRGDSASYHSGPLILFVGDEYAFGPSVDSENTIPSLVATKLLARGYESNAINLGVNGYNSLQSLMVLTDCLVEQNPRQVIVCYVVGVRAISRTTEPFFAGSIPRPFYAKIGANTAAIENKHSDGLELETHSYLVDISTLANFLWLATKGEGPSSISCFDKCLVQMDRVTKGFDGCFMTMLIDEGHTDYVKYFLSLKDAFDIDTIAPPVLAEDDFGELGGLNSSGNDKIADIFVERILEILQNDKTASIGPAIDNDAIIE